MTRDAHLQRAGELYNKREYQEASIEAQRAADIDPKCGPAFHVMALCANNTGERLKALDYYQKALKLSPNDPSLYFNIGTLAWSLGYLEGAAQTLRGYLKLRPNCPSGYNNLAGVLRDLGEIDDAVTVCRDGILRTPKSSALWNTLGSIMGEVTEFETAIVFYEEAIRQAHREQQPMFRATEWVDELELGDI